MPKPFEALLAKSASELPIVEASRELREFSETLVEGWLCGRSCRVPAFECLDHRADGLVVHELRIHEAPAMNGARVVKMLGGKNILGCLSERLPKEVKID